MTLSEGVRRGKMEGKEREGWGNEAAEEEKGKEESVLCQ